MPVISPISHIVGRARIVRLLVARRLSWRQRQKARSHLNVLVTGNYSRSYRLLAIVAGVYRPLKLSGHQELCSLQLLQFCLPRCLQQLLSRTQFAHTHRSCCTSDEET